MSAPWFSTTDNLNWIRLWLILGMATAFWAGLAALTVLWPPFDLYYKIVNIVLGAISAPVLFAARGTKYVVNRIEPPANGKP